MCVKRKTPLKRECPLIYGSTAEQTGEGKEKEIRRAQRCTIIGRKPIPSQSGRFYVKAVRSESWSGVSLVDLVGQDLGWGEAFRDWS